ncbi:MAG TPA: hypothetical protein DCM86_00230 [Verrucomicrobiales bacterium]|nr:hypothetical protein [Verrucomicrobiales bacterium]
MVHGDSARRHPRLPHSMQSFSANQASTLVIFGLAFGMMVTYLAVTGLICFLILRCLKVVPPEHRKIELNLIWLLMIPCFGVIWNFYVYQRVPASFQSYFASLQRTDVGDCGKSLGLWYAICGVVACIPLANTVAGPAALVLIILNLVKYHDLRSQVLRLAPPGA